MSDRIDDAKAIAIDIFGEDDVIRRVDAVEALAEWGISPLVLMPVPSAQQWIPCSERLPEVGRCVLLSVGGLYTAEGCLRDDGDWNQFRWDAIQRKDMVGAWMPLPEPYTKDGE